MAGPTRAAGKRANLRSTALPSATAPQVPQSSGTTVPDDTMTRNFPAGYGTPQPSQGNGRPDISRLSQSLEPLTIRNGTPLGSGDTSASFVGDEVNALGAGVNKVRDAISAIAKLEVLGLDRYDIPLPKCVVLGAQSTGKSSVIESISSIRTPRATDTCTRCPLFIKTESATNPNAGWEASVSLRSTFEPSSKRTQGHKYRFPGWVECNQPHEVHFGGTTSPDDLEELIFRAQLATLNAEEQPNVFLRGSIASLQASYNFRQFSPNVVCIHITQPGLPSLSFYDLPGIIGQAENVEEQYLVKFVKDLVTEYICDQDALILVTHSLADDIHNSPAGGLARDHNVTSRCVGVLTKPDCLPAGGSEETLRAVLDGRSFKLGHGYFVVKNLSQDGIAQGLSNRDARDRERVFFAAQTPWATSLQRYQDRFGTNALQAFLSKKLATQTISALPTIRDKIAERLSDNERELGKIPEPPTHNAVHVVNECIAQFTQHVLRDLEGDYGHYTFINNWQALQKSFADALEMMRPRFVPNGDRDIGISSSSATSGRSADDSIVIDDSDAEIDGQQRFPTPETPSKKRKLDSQPSTPMKTLRQPGISSTPISKYKDYGHVFRLDEVVALLSQISKTRIPGQLQPKVLDSKMIETEKSWHLPIEDFFVQLESFLKAALRSVFEKYFHQWREAGLHQAAWTIVDTALKAHLSEQRNMMAPEALRDEREGPYVFYSSVWDKEKESILEVYRRARFENRAKIYWREIEASTGKVMSDNEKRTRVQKDMGLRARLMEEPYSQEVDFIAKLASYYKIASHRLHDSICMRIEGRFFKFLKSKLYEELTSGLEIWGENGHDNCIRLLAENSAREERRQYLLRQKEALLKGQGLLNSLEEDYGSPSNPLNVSSSEIPHGLPMNPSGTLSGEDSRMSTVIANFPNDATEFANNRATFPNGSASFTTNGYSAYGNNTRSFSMNGNFPSASMPNPFAARVDEDMDDVKY